MMEGVKTVVNVDELMQPSRDRFTISYERTSVIACCPWLPACHRRVAYVVRRAGSWCLTCEVHLYQVVDRMRQG